MRLQETALPGVMLIDLDRFEDLRGVFYEVHHANKYAKVGIPGPFVQDNVSRSVQATLRGLHYQRRHAQGKLVTVARGAVYDVVVDIRVGSPTFRRWCGVILTEEEPRTLWVPPGFAHGYCVLSDYADLTYSCTDVHVPEQDRAILWCDSTLRIEWPVKDPLVSDRDRNAPRPRGTENRKAPRRRAARARATPAPTTPERARADTPAPRTHRGLPMRCAERGTSAGAPPPAARRVGA
jgi:dTDP-4-dehydrorhamnose 3,5-epimerase